MKPVAFGVWTAMKKAGTIVVRVIRANFAPNR
jgi:hypothetical protein